MINIGQEKYTMITGGGAESNLDVMILRHLKLSLSIALSNF